MRGQAVGLALAGGDHALADRGGGRRLLGAQRLRRRGGRRRSARRSGPAAGRTGGGGGARGRRRVQRQSSSPIPHGHGFDAATSMNRVGNAITFWPRTIVTCPSSSGWRSASRLGAHELAQLVEEQHAVVGERRLAGRRVRAAADQAGGRDRVVRRAERARGDEPAAVVQARRPTGSASPRSPRPAMSGGRIDGSRRASIVLPVPGRAVQVEVVAAGGGDLERRDQRVVAAHVGEVQRAARRSSARLGRRSAARRRLGVAAQERDRLLDACRRRAPRSSGTSAASRARGRGTQQPRAGRGGARPRRSRARRAPPAARRSATARRRPRSPRAASWRELPAGDEQRDRQRQVEARADLAQVGRREVDGDAPQRELEAASSRAPPARARAPRGPPCRRARRP